MARKPRKVSSTGFYHVMQRGVNLFDIFETDDDRRQYLEFLMEAADQFRISIHAWCLMSNHTHLLLRGDICNLSYMMHRLGSRYASYFNRQHERIGHLFDGRFESVCIESDAQYLAVVRYIHRNPVEHQEQALRGTYPWSSYVEYVSGKAIVSQIDMALEMLGSTDGFVRFHKQDASSDERHLDIGTLGRLTDDEARSRANAALENAGFAVCVGNIGRLSRRLRDKAIAVIKQSVGCSLRQMQRLTSLAYHAIRTAVLKADASTNALSDAPGNRTCESAPPRHNDSHAIEGEDGKPIRSTLLPREELRRSLKLSTTLRQNLALESKLATSSQSVVP